MRMDDFCMVDLQYFLRLGHCKTRSKLLQWQGCGLLLGDTTGVGAAVRRKQRVLLACHRVVRMLGGVWQGHPDERDAVPVGGPCQVRRAAAKYLEKLRALRRLRLVGRRVVSVQRRLWRRVAAQADLLHARSDMQWLWTFHMAGLQKPRRLSVARP